jgi:3-hydroxyacyl-[acyl-carrier-protein] dehydratase
MAAGSKEISFALDHPTAAGHFPGHPIIPGALLLDAILGAVLGDIEAPEPHEVRMAKFLQPVRPGDRVRIDWRPIRGEMHFRCTLVESEAAALTGTLRRSSERE